MRLYAIFIATSYILLALINAAFAIYAYTTGDRLLATGLVAFAAGIVIIASYVIKKEMEKEDAEGGFRYPCQAGGGQYPCEDDDETRYW